MWVWTSMTGAGFMRFLLLLALDAAVGDDLLPAVDLALDPRAHRLGAARRGHAAEAGEPLVRVGLAEDRGELAVQVVDGGARRAGRDGEAEPGAELDAPQGLAHGRHLGQQRVAAGGRE